MNRIASYKKLFDYTKETDLAKLKTSYRNLMKEWHPDKFTNDPEKAAEAEKKSKTIIEAYHFLVSIAPETIAANAEEYTLTTTASLIEDFNYKGQTLNISFTDGSAYEYFGVPPKVYQNLVNSSTQLRFAKRHIFASYLYRNIKKKTEQEA